MTPTHAHEVATRQANAKAAFAALVVSASGCTRDEAAAVTRFYLAHRLAKLDSVVGRITVKHGAFLEPAVIRNAIGQATAL